MKQDINEDLLIKYILGETTSSEEQKVDLWIKASSANAKVFEQFKFILESGKQLAEDSPADVTEEWEKFKIKRMAPKGTAKVRALNWYSGWIQVAAAVLILMTGLWTGYYFYNRQTYPGTALVSLKTLDKVLVATLPDGSVIHMNKNSAISYARNFTAQRDVKLTGEAFFEVKHNESVPFTVYAGNVKISDVGTAFNVKSKTGWVEVIVETGIVQVSKNALSVRLRSREMVRIKPEDQQLIKEANTDLLYNYYRSNQLILNNTPLSHVVEILNEAYGAHIKIEGEELKNIPITVTSPIAIDVKNDSPDKILQVLLLTSPEIHLSRSGNNIVLKK
ncbi:FecR family protein [Mucilaginibacter sp. UR6-11]|uniref:FecR family protein n=1 Tax=Mucilaginibacter sp. UR6-11 TaxID=1435644 RepID=UPI001E5B756D|nr:FecR domain-containing protein [Mucilaginibacter sp. UR6-11]MCC8423476.1 FecR domain-containing protein [Mucilaginibacter sp. UR6-11]